MKLGFLLTNVAAVTETWTSAHLAHAALEAGHEVRLFEPWSHEVTEHGRLVARAWALAGPSGSRAELIRKIRRGALPRRYVELASLDRLFLRVNPLTAAALQVALLAHAAGVEVINDPMGVSLTRTKAWLASLADVPRPPTLVTSSRASVDAFRRQHPDAELIVKPTASSGGRGVALVPPGRLGALHDAVDQARRIGSGHVVLQTCVPEADRGEKRLVWVDGQILGGYLRLRADGDFRHNLKRGGQPTPCDIEPSDEVLSRAISPHLSRNGIRIAGLDVIGGQLIEVNTLNPGGIHWSDTLGSGSIPIATRAIQLLTRPVHRPGPTPEPEEVHSA